MTLRTRDRGGRGRIKFVNLADVALAAGEFHSHKLDLQNPSNDGWHFCDVEGHRTRFSLIFFFFPPTNRRTAPRADEQRSRPLLPDVRSCAHCPCCRSLNLTLRSSLSLNYGLIYRGKIATSPPRLLSPLPRSLLRFISIWSEPRQLCTFCLRGGDRICLIPSANRERGDGHGPLIFNEALSSERQSYFG